MGLDQETNISKRNLISFIFLFFYLLAFYGIMTIIIPDIFFAPDYRVIIKLAASLTICITIGLSTFFTEKINRVIFAYVEPIVVVTLSVLLYVTSGFLRLTIIFLMTVIFSNGILLFFRYFWNVTRTSERARVSGIIAFSVLPFVFLLELIPENGVNYLYFPILTVILNVGIIALISTRSKRNFQINHQQTARVFEKKVVILYSIPWVLFSFVNVTLAKDITINIIRQIPSSLHIFLIGLQAIGVNAGAILAGFLADYYGRRITLAVSLTLYGTSSVIAGIVWSESAFSAMYFINGLAWGILFVLYFFVVFGDLSNVENSAKMYSIGLVTYFLSLAIGDIYQALLPSIISSLLTCLLLFLSIVPIFIAPELLSSNLREKAKLAKYVERVKKLQKIRDK
jgi:hypothetical protein